VLTEFVLELAAERNLPAKPFLLVLATSANTVDKLLTDGQVQASKFLMLSGKTKSLSMYLSLVIIFSPVRCGECRAVTRAMARLGDCYCSCDLRVDLFLEDFLVCSWISL
jgi:hypothetical protein